MSPGLVVHGLTKRYGKLLALDDVSFTARPGEILGIIGPNGAGKTTLLECITGQLATDAGTITTSTPLFYLPDAIAPWPAQTVRWALAFATGFLGGQSGAVPDIVRALSLSGFLDQPIGTLSKGQRKRTVLAVGLLAPQPILVCDEPFDGLDLRQTRDIAAVLRATAAAGRTLILSIHQIADAAHVCDRFVLLSGGRVCGEGTVEELTARAGLPPASSGLPEVFLALT